tara:strand:- start:43 stop:570 length:528 start_codon:yes stop_codon:yes gene_type:complete
VKKINAIILIFLYFVYGCVPYSSKEAEITNVSCPKILFAAEHKNYIDSSQEILSLDNLSLQAEINNAIFSEECKIQNNIFSTNLSLLFIINPIDQSKQAFILPFYIAMIDKNKKTISTDYYSATGTLKKDLDSKDLIETEMTKTVPINVDASLINEDTIFLIGFILDKKRIELLD